MVSGDVWSNNEALSAFFHVENIFELYQAETSWAGYWLAPDKIQATFIINLGCQQTFSAIKLVNTHNNNNRDRATKKFRYTYTG